MFDLSQGMFGGDEMPNLGGHEFQFVWSVTLSNRVSPPSILIGDTITMSSSTSGATIYYTTDGSTPDATKTEYTGEIALPEVTTTYKTIAVKADMNDSAIRTAVYTVTDIFTTLSDDTILTDLTELADA